MRLSEARASGNDISIGRILSLGMGLGRPLAQADPPEAVLAVLRPGGGSTAPLGIVTAEEMIAATG